MYLGAGKRILWEVERSNKIKLYGCGVTEASQAYQKYLIYLDSMRKALDN